MASLAEHLAQPLWQLWEQAGFGQSFGRIRVAEQPIAGVDPNSFPGSLSKQLVYAGTCEQLGDKKFLRDLTKVTHEHCQIVPDRGQHAAYYAKCLGKLARAFYLPSESVKRNPHQPAWLSIIPRRVTFRKRWSETNVRTFQDRATGHSWQIPANARRRRLPIYSYGCSFPLAACLDKVSAQEKRETRLFRVLVPRTFGIDGVLDPRNYSEQWYYLGHVEHEQCLWEARVPGLVPHFCHKTCVVQAPIITFCKVDFDGWLHHISYEIDPWDGSWLSLKSVSVKFWSYLLSDPNNHWMLWKTLQPEHYSLL
jgi:hypothetical protein